MAWACTVSMVSAVSKNLEDRCLWVARVCRA